MAVDLAGLADRARRGDAAAFEALVGVTLGRLLRLATAIVLDEAEAGDVVQEAFVAAWRQLPSLRDPAGIDAWLTRITVNEARQALRARRRRRVREVTVDDEALAVAAERNGGAGGPAGGPGDAGASADARLLTSALARLDVDQRTLLALHHLEGHDVAELAAALDIPTGTVKSRLFAARRALRAALAAEAAE